MSVGGNDAGFAKVIMHALVPLRSDGNHLAGRASLAALHKLLDTVSAEESETRVNAMAANYKLVAAELNAQFGIKPSALFFMAYPNPLMRPAARRKNGEDYYGLELRSAMEAARMRGAPVTRPWWHFWMTSAESEKVAGKMLAHLQGTIANSIPPDSHLISSHLAALEQEHGLCADAEKFENDASSRQAHQADVGNVSAYGMPRQQLIDGGLERLASMSWMPYDTSFKRWIRTPNDSVRTQTTNDAARSMAGAFHPTGAGYAAIADAAWTALDGYLNTARTSPSMHDTAASAGAK